MSKCLKAKDIIGNFDAIAEDYKYKPEDVFREDSSKVEGLKIILSSLNYVDRTIAICYAETASAVEVAKILHVSPRMGAYEVKRVKDLIISRFNSLKEGKRPILEPELF